MNKTTLESKMIIDLETRIIGLEEKFSYQDDLVSKLNIIVTNQEGVITELVEEVMAIKKDANGQGTGGNGPSEPPPHY